MSAGRIRVLVVDDSALVRRTVSRLIAADPDFEVVGTAVNGRDALAKAEALDPQVVTLDLAMPVMDGMTCLHHLVRERRQRVIVLSTLSKKNSFATFRALALGAVDFVTKPGESSYLSSLEELGQELRAKLRVAAAVPESQIGQKRRAQPAPESCEATAGEVVSLLPSLQGVVGIGGSTGGTVSLETIVRGLPALLPVSLLVVQHIPRGFSGHFARYLNSISRFRVEEARDGTVLQPQCAYVAPGGVHLRVQRTAQGLLVRTGGGAMADQGFRPSVDQLFFSLATALRERAVAVVLSGIGEDGVSGVRAVRRLGGHTIVQDRSTSVVFDMPARALATGDVQRVLPPESIPAALSAVFRGAAMGRRDTESGTAEGRASPVPSRRHSNPTIR